ncbi:MAG: hypothetical protein Q8R47_03070 [Nanoarchaeota archaeon]|nr:hypothetical protein [Nanoarchaeota archaeon]
MKIKEADKNVKRSLVRRICRWIGIASIAVVILVVIAGILIYYFSEPSEDYNTDYRFTTDLSKETVTREGNFTNISVGSSKRSFDLWYGEKELLNFSQTGGKRCDELNLITVDNFTYLKCSFGKTEFLEGDYISLRVLSKCDEYCAQKAGADLYVYPADVRGSTGRTTVESVILLPKGYTLFNTSITGYSIQETADRVTVSFKTDLKYGKVIWETYGGLLFYFKKKVDFSRIKSYERGKLTLTYPAGFEEESWWLINSLSQVLPEFEKYAGRGVSYRDIIFRTVVNASVLGGYAGMAHAAKTIDGKDSVNLSITAVHSSTPFHELCHLAEKPLEYPRWFSEGQAENCGKNLLKALGRDSEAELVDKYNTNHSNLPGDIKLPEWKTPNVTFEGDNLTEKGYGLSYMLFKEVLPFVDMPLFYTKMREKFRSVWELPNDAVICTLDEAAASNIILIFEKYGFRVDCSRVVICQSEEILGENSECVEKCGTFCKSEKIDTKSDVCQYGYKSYGYKFYGGKCERPCYFRDNKFYHCASGNYCYKNKCLAPCTKIGPEYSLYEDGHCYAS